MISSILQYVIRASLTIPHIQSRRSVNRNQTSTSLCLWILLLLVRTNGNYGAHAHDTRQTAANSLEDRQREQEQFREMQNNHSRQKRLLWVTSDGRLALPPGTTMVINPSLSLPFIRYPPEGFLSNMTIALPFTINFDQLGLTDNENPYGVPPPLLARSMGEEVGNILGQYVMRLLKHRRRRRSVENNQNELNKNVDQPNGKVHGYRYKADSFHDKSDSYRYRTDSFQRESDSYRYKTDSFQEESDSNVNEEENVSSPPKLPKQHEHAFHGGERALMYIVAEEFLENFGMDGRACLLRAICEVHANRLHNFGIIGEMVKLFLTASKSPFAEMIPEYVDAENAGRGKSGAAECWPYLKDCPKSLFQSKHNLYSKEFSTTNDVTSDKNEQLGKSEKVTYDTKLLNM